MQEQTWQLTKSGGIAVADECVSSNDDDGVAEAIERFVLKPRGIQC